MTHRSFLKTDARIVLLSKFQGLEKWRGRKWRGRGHSVAFLQHFRLFLCSSIVDAATQNPISCMAETTVSSLDK